MSMINDNEITTQDVDLTKKIIGPGIGRLK